MNQQKQRRVQGFFCHPEMSSALLGHPSHLYQLVICDIGARLRHISGLGRSPSCTPAAAGPCLAMPTSLFGAFLVLPPFCVCFVFSVLNCSAKFMRKPALSSLGPWGQGRRRRVGGWGGEECKTHLTMMIVLETIQSSDGVIDS